MKLSEDRHNDVPDEQVETKYKSKTEQIQDRQSSVEHDLGLDESDE